MNTDHFAFPVRTSRSLEDNLLLQAQKMAQGIATTINITASWNDMFESRPFDTPLYTSLNERACILVYLSSNAIENRNWIAEVLAKSDVMKIHFAAFLQGRYPILRSNYFFPRQTSYPLVLETPLDIRDGHVQDFCSAILADPAIDLIVKHQQNDEQWYHSAFYASELPRILKRTLQEALAHFQHTLTRNDFNNSYRLMTDVIPSSDSDIRTSNLVSLRRIGYAKNTLINKEFSADSVKLDSSNNIESFTPTAGVNDRGTITTKSDPYPSDTGKTGSESFNVRTIEIDLSDNHSTEQN